MIKEQIAICVSTMLFFASMTAYADSVKSPETVDNTPTEQSVVIQEKLAVRPSPSPKAVSFTMTAYCPCEICCGEWANNRPDGKVYGASGRELVPGYSIAVDPDIIPLGTIVKIDGRKYRADDVGGAVQGNKIDLYVSTHEEAMDIGIRDCEVEIWD